MEQQRLASKQLLFRMAVARLTRGETLMWLCTGSIITGVMPPALPGLSKVAWLHCFVSVMTVAICSLMDIASPLVGSMKMKGGGVQVMLLAHAQECSSSAIGLLSPARLDYCFKLALGC